MSINKYFQALLSSNFYNELGVTPPTRLGERELHDVCDHAMGPFEGYLPTDFVGEVKAELNSQARRRVFQYLYNEWNKPCWEDVRDDIFQTHRGLARYGIPMEYPPEEELKIFFLECIAYWEESELLLEVVELQRTTR